MECDKLKIYELMVGELSFEESRSLLEHIRVCKTCSERARIMGALSNSPPVIKTSKKSNRHWLYAAAATVAIILIPLSLFVWKPDLESTSSFEELATRQLFPYFPLEVRALANRTKKEAFQAYSDDRLSEAETLFNQIEEPDPEIYFFRGVTRYLLRKDEGALKDLEKSRNYPHWRQASTWYLANLYLRAGKRLEALRELETILGESGSFKADARRLTEEIQVIPDDK